MKWLTGINKLLFKVFYLFAYHTAKAYSKRKRENTEYYVFQAKTNITKWLYERVKEIHTYQECVEETERVWKICEEGKDE